jgi:hypothetical protein
MSAGVCITGAVACKWVMVLGVLYGWGWARQAKQSSKTASKLTTRAAVTLERN